MAEREGREEGGDREFSQAIRIYVNYSVNVGQLQLRNAAAVDLATPGLTD